jgi:dTDP-4-dehydrorhamnose 3,5-epimerase
MKIHTTSIPDLFVIETTPQRDNRGGFVRLYCDSALAACIGNRRIVQVNQSFTALKGSIRGMHYQLPPNAEMKIIRCLSGRVWDVAVDLRYGSKSFLHWHAEELTPTNNRSVLIPEGFAHGFQALEAASELLYFHTSHYAPASEDGVRFNDPALAIEWPIKVGDISARDMSHPILDKNFTGIRL